MWNINKAIDDYWDEMSGDVYEAIRQAFIAGANWYRNEGGDDDSNSEESVDE